MVKKIGDNLYEFKNGVQAKKLDNGQYRIVKGASAKILNKIRKHKKSKK